MGRQLKIGIDIDNVLADTAATYLEQFNIKFGTSLAYEALISQDLMKLEHGIETSQVQEFIDKVINTAEFQLEVLPYQEAIDVVTKWSKQGHSIHYITARPIAVRHSTQQWLSRHGLMVEGATLDLIDPDKYTSDPEYKADIAKKIGIDYMIEDTKKITLAMPVPVFLIDRPWNQGELPEHVQRVKDWKEIEGLI
jgi:uncharacterized HAD superfamily protein